MTPTFPAMEAAGGCEAAPKMTMTTTTVSEAAALPPTNAMRPAFLSVTGGTASRLHVNMKLESYILSASYKKLFLFLACHCFLLSIPIPCFENMT